MPGEPDQIKWRGVRPVSGIRGIWPARNATRISIDDLQVGLGIGVLYTVPANKILFIASAWLTARLSDNAEVRAKLSVRDAGDNEVIILCYHLLDKAGQISAGIPYSPALEVPAAYDVFVDSSSDFLDCMGLVTGWQEDA